MSSHHHHVNVSSKSGPARMATTQDAFRKELERRLRDLGKVLRRTVDENNALDLPIERARDNVDAVSRFEFRERSRDEVFREWWEDAVDEGFLDPLPDDRVRRGEHYSASYVRNGYVQGVEWADMKGRQFDFEVPDIAPQTVIQRPVHQEALRTVYSRSYSELKTAARRAENDVARVLTREMSAGENSRVIGDKLAEEIRIIRRRDARRIARSEVMNAHSNATGLRYNEIGVDKVSILTSDPCPVCQDLAAGGPYDTRQGMSLLPAHPNCVCCLIPANPRQ